MYTRWPQNNPLGILYNLVHSVVSPVCRILHNAWHMLQNTLYFSHTCYDLFVLTQATLESDIANVSSQLQVHLHILCRRPRRTLHHMLHIQWLLRLMFPHTNRNYLGNLSIFIIKQDKYKQYILGSESFTK